MQSNFDNAVHLPAVSDDAIVSPEAQAEMERWANAPGSPAKKFTQRTTKSDGWATPRVVFDRIAAEFGPFDLDPCADAGNAKAQSFYTVEQDGLSLPWTGTVFVNPPFSNIEAWVEKAYQASVLGAVVVMLIPARTGAGWWHRWVQGRARVKFLRGRIKYEGAPHNAPFDSCVAVFESLPDGRRR